ncbi:tetratricopeptide repeat protein [Leptolyngbya sp. CCNP1308]|uniref:tetratricopeptide repeat protein n=1 Tax=Leptolyngbya sp. CCNP1308 TaxID=3110255 RepID=UPI002B219B9D|nr:tetratricopeptide repeat protein [Leptolyngbya sp. CCNP1308]MEA5448378.1 tetratricopeptide repeat protein [Leptolyngbya sp. CCNP1308]
MTLPPPVLESDDFFASAPWAALENRAAGEWLPPPFAEVLADGVLVAPALETALAAVEVSSPWHYAHAMALVQWLQGYTPPSSASLDQVRGWLEAFYHASEAELWGVAGAIAAAYTETGTPLYRQLGRWGHRREQVDLCEAMLPHVAEPLQRELRQLAGDGRRQLGAYDTARRHYEALVQECQSLQARLGLAQIAMAQLSHRTAIPPLVALLPEAEALGDAALTIEVQQQLALAYGYTGRSGHSLALLQRALALANTHGLSDLEVTTLQTLAKIYEWRGQSQRSLPYFNRILAVAQAQQNLALEADALSGLARASFCSRQFAAAIAHGERSLALYRQIYHADRELLTLNDLGAIYAYGLGQMPAALAYFQQAERLARQVGSLGSVAIVTANQAYCHVTLGQRDLAQRASQTAFAIARQDEVVAEHRMVAYACLARVHWADHHYGKALALVWQALCMEPPWRSINGQLLLTKTWETLRQLPQQWWQAHFERPQR